MKDDICETFLFSHLPDRYLFSVINLLSPVDSYVFFNDYSNRVSQINNLAPSRNKIRKEDLFCIEGLISNFFIDFFEIYGSPISSNPHNYFSIKKGVPVKNENGAVSFFIFINKLIRKLLLTKLKEIDNLSFIKKMSPKVYFLKKDIISSVMLIDDRIDSCIYKDGIKAWVSVRKICDKKNFKTSNKPAKKTFPKRLNLLKITSFSNNTLTISEIQNAMSHKPFSLNNFYNDFFSIEDDFSVKKISFLFSVADSVFLGKNIQDLKKNIKLTPIISRKCFYLRSETASDESFIDNIRKSIFEIRSGSSFMLFDEDHNSFELLNPYEHYISFVNRNIPSLDISFFNDILPEGFYDSKIKNESTISVLNNMLLNDKMFIFEHISGEDNYESAIKSRNSMIEKEISKLQEIKERQ